MAVARTTAASRALGRTILRRTTSQPRPQAWRKIGRRNYATGHEKKSSDLPWIIGSTAFTVPAAVWLYGQGPEKGGAHHAEEAHEEEGGDEDAGEKDEGEPAEEADDSKSGDKEEEEESTDEKKPQKEGEDDSGPDESKEESSEESSDKESSEKEPSDKEASDKESSNDDKKGDDTSKDSSNEDKEGDEPSKKQKGSVERKMSDDGYELPGTGAPGQINYKPGSGKGPGEGQKGPRRPSETKGTKDSAKNFSGAKNPNLDNADWLSERSKKHGGMADTMKIHGTVDSRQPGRND